MKATRTLSSYVLLVGVMGLSIVGGIVAYQIYSASVKSQTTKEQAVAIKPLDGVINEKTIEELKKRRVYNDSEITLLLNTQAVTPTPTIEASLPPTEASVSASPAATGSSAM
jgi:hypothetical protein